MSTQDSLHSYHKTKSKSDYQRNIRANVRALWAGERDTVDFYNLMFTAIDRGFTQAWHEGAKTCGIMPDELSTNERNKLRSEIILETQYISRFGDVIDTNSRANGGKLTPLMQRAQLWVDKYNRIRDIAKVMACEDVKYEWVLNPAEHCRSCLKLAGKVKRGSVWAKTVQPKDWDNLDCKIGCKCELKPTDKPLSKGPLPALP